MKFESLRKLWIHELKTLYSAENQILAMSREGDRLRVVGHALSSPVPRSSLASSPGDSRRRPPCRRDELRIRPGRAVLRAGTELRK